MVLPPGAFKFAVVETLTQSLQYDTSTQLRLYAILVYSTLVFTSLCGKVFVNERYEVIFEGLGQTGQRGV